MESSSTRLRNLERIFRSFISGKRQIQRSQDAKRFLEAADAVCQGLGVSSCVETIVANVEGINVVKTAVRSGLSQHMVIDSLNLLVKHFLDSQIRVIGDGHFLRQLLDAVLSPPTFWSALLQAYQADALRDDGLENFAHLCFEIVSNRQSCLEKPHHDIEQLMSSKKLLESSNLMVRSWAYRIQKVLQLTTPTDLAAFNATAGGRHDNDFADFRKIAIYPTEDEIRCKGKPFLQWPTEVFNTPETSRLRTYRDWLFRLLREDMLAGLREEISVTLDQTEAKRFQIRYCDLSVPDQKIPDPSLRRPRTLMIQCRNGVTFPKMVSSVEQKALYLRNNTNFVKHSSLGAFCCGSSVIAFGSLLRDKKLLVEDIPILVIQFASCSGLCNAIKALLGPRRKELQFCVVATSTFAYEPILERLKHTTDIPLEESLAGFNEPVGKYDPPYVLKLLIDALVQDESRYGTTYLSKSTVKMDVRIEGAQLKSLINGLANSTALIQGPPGTGKSFIGALILKLILRCTDFKVLVLSYTNHALDQFLQDLMQIDVEADEMVRMGSKHSLKTQGLALETYIKQPKYWSDGLVSRTIVMCKDEAAEVSRHLDTLLETLKKPVSDEDVLSMLELSDEYEAYWEAFQVPEEECGFQVAAKSNTPLTPTGLYRMWYQDESPVDRLSDSGTWALPKEARHQLHEKWCSKVREEQMSLYAEITEKYAQLGKQIDDFYNETKRNVLREKRVIGSTTTAAAKYQSIIAAAAPNVVLVEEAGQILESHVFAALGHSVKQLILIGDHKQLRPKINNYSLSVEKGDGYDLNMSLFERLIQRGHSYTRLEEQHRSHPDISYFTRLLAYPTLTDNGKVQGRPNVRGLQKRVVFVHHEHSERQMQGISDECDPTTNTSKENTFEAEMVLKTVIYLGQQGYSCSDIVILTPYLGQLSLLQQKLGESHETLLNDLDNADLIRAGHMISVASQVKKGALRLCTIDNYQGEESEIVIVSLTRSNANGDIGFLSARERLVVLMSRAKSGMVLFGNMHTLMSSRKGGQLWTQYFEALKSKNSLFEGLPVHCERHPKWTALLKTPADFDECCPDGGCTQKCGARLACGKHYCHRRCHRVQDHSEMPCGKSVAVTCDRGHSYNVPCDQRGRSCKICKREDNDTRRRMLRDRDMDMARQTQHMAYSEQLIDLEGEISCYKKAAKHEADQETQKQTLAQKQAELDMLKNRKTQMDAAAVRAQAKGNDKDDAKDDDKDALSCADGSPAKKEWDMMKKSNGAQNSALDELMKLIGLESVKNAFLDVKANIDLKIRQGVSLNQERLGCSLLGNPGTGKTTVARIWGRFLTTIGAVSGSAFTETTGAKLANDGVSACEKILDKIKSKGGGVLFVDEAYQLASGNNIHGKAVLDYLLGQVETLRGKVVFVLAGYQKQMEQFFAHNPGFPSRFPIEMKFDDYEDAELLSILGRKIHDKYNGSVVVEGGMDGLFTRILARRIGRGRGKEGFGNARAVENSLGRMEIRQARRLRSERAKGNEPDDFFFSQQDIIGPAPAAKLGDCKAWQTLNDMIGLEKVKQEVKVLLDSLKTNYQRELDEAPLMQFSLNRVFTGSPGTGKTTVAKLYGRILADLGFLSNGEIVVKTPADFVGSVMGQSEANTKGILAATVGKVLVIDEAYGLYPGSGHNSYREAIIDTIVAEVQNVPGEDRCVIMVGYQEKMDEMFQHVNPGLSRRFAVDSPFVFEDFDREQLKCVLKLKLKTSGFTATDEAKRTALEVLVRESNRPNFGNGGAVDNLLSRAKAGLQKRLSDSMTSTSVLEAIDFDADFERADRKDTNLGVLFNGEIGREKLIALLEQYQTRVRQLRHLGLEPRDEIPFNFLFRGPPGTGKTTTARKMGKVYYDMGFLQTAKVVESSASDMMGKYVGQTGPKVRDLLDKALGSVLFIDEAYRLAGNGYAKEAIDELVDQITKPRYQGKLIVILAGYTDDINRLLSVNPGMSSRFPESIDFEPLRPTECMTLLRNKLMGRKAILAEKGVTLDLACLESPSETFHDDMQSKFEALAKTRDWGNARDVIQLAKSIYGHVQLSSSHLQVEQGFVRDELDKMLRDRVKKDEQQSLHTSPSLRQMMEELHSAPPPPPPRAAEAAKADAVATKMDVAQSHAEAGSETTEPPREPDAGDKALARRDAGVSDAAWDQLQDDGAQEMQREAELERLKQDAHEAAAGAARERIWKEIVEREERKREESRIKRWLASLDVCPNGYLWIKQVGGYCCAGGAHFVTDEEIRRSCL